MHLKGWIYSLLIPACVLPAESRALRIEESLEAETAILTEGMLIRDDFSASGGQFIHMPKGSGAALFELTVDTTARYHIYICYRSVSGDNAQRLRINRMEYTPEIGFPRSELWTEIIHAAGLRAGPNTLELAASWGNMDIDYLYIEGPVTDPPDRTPAQNFWTRNTPRESMTIQLDKNHNPFTGITCSGDTVPFESAPVFYLEDAVRIQIPAITLNQLEGTSELQFHFTNQPPLPFTVHVRDTIPPSDWIIISPDVSHGTAVWMRLPTGKSLLIDTGTEAMCRDVVIPFLEQRRITPDYLWITHHHQDHEGGVPQIQEKYPDILMRDNHDFHTGDQFEFEMVNMLILNSAEDGHEKGGENSRSLSIRMAWHDFVYTHGGDIYGANQNRILSEYRKSGKTDLLKTHVYHANHHFHGSVDIDYLKAIDPCLILVSGEEHIYGRGAYTELVQKQVLPWLRENGKRFQEDLLAFETGHTVIRIIDGQHWNYETCFKLEDIQID